MLANRQLLSYSVRRMKESKRPHRHHQPFGHRTVRQHLNRIGNRPRLARLHELLNPHELNINLESTRILEKTDKYGDGVEIRHSRSGGNKQRDRQKLADGRGDAPLAIVVLCSGTARK